MSTSTIKQLPKQTVEIEITIPWMDIKTTYEEIFNKVISELEISGFRKGKVPKNIAQKHVNKSRIYEEVVQKILPKAYSEAVKQHNLSPLTAPKLEILKAKENEDWSIKTTIALLPKITLHDYKQKIKDLKAGKTKLWVPGKSEKEEKPAKPAMDEIVKIVLESSEIEISDLLVDQEMNRLLSDLIDQTKKLGMTVEQYLLAKGKTSLQLREEYKLQALRNLQLEFALNEIADQEKITVEEKDINQILDKVEKQEEKERLRKESYYLAHLVRQQKLLDFLSNL